MPKQKRLEAKAYETIKQLLYQGLSTGAVWNKLKNQIPNLKRTHIYVQNRAVKIDLAGKHEFSDLTTAKTELDNNASTDALEIGEVTNMSIPIHDRDGDKPRMGSNDTVETPVAVRPSVVRRAKQVPATSSAIESAIMTWELQGFTITTTRCDTINIELSPESLKDIVNHLLR